MRYPSFLFIEKTYFVFLALVFLSLGFLGQHYYVTHENQFQPPKYSTDEIRRVRTLFRKLHRTEFENANLESQLAELNLSIAEHYDEQNFHYAQRLTQMAGLVPQQGPGVEVILKDSNKPLLLGDNPNTGIVHNTDILQVINDLRAAGASAISVNEQPVGSNTAITCAGPIISINETRITSPFKIQAIGPTQKILNRLDQPDSFIKELQVYGIEVTIIPREKTTVASYLQNAVF